MSEEAAPGALGPLDLSQFPAVSTHAWQALVRRDLGDRATLDSLHWRTEDGIALAPWYRAEDLVGLETEAAAAHGRRGPWVPLQKGEWPADAIRADRWHDAGATAVLELAWALAEGVDRLDAVRVAGRPLDRVATNVPFVFAVGSAYFVEIAKLRALRRLWAAVVDAFAPAEPEAATLRLYVRTSRANKSTWDTPTNLLRATTEAMAAAIGGADGVLVEAHGYPEHVAANVPRILAEEASLAAVDNPADGAYLVEVLTDRVARAAWTAFQGIEAAGGYSAAVRAGRLDEQLRAAREARARAVATRARTLVGVNDYPDLGETGPSPGPYPPVDAELPVVRLAAPFEALRARTRRHHVAGGRTPVVHLLTHGDPAASTARAHYCLNVFGCAGLAITQGDAPSPDADLILLCARDADLLALARSTAAAVAVPILVAGAPGAHAESLTEIGVQGFVHRGIDVLALLSTWQDRLGIAP